MELSVSFLPALPHTIAQDVRMKEMQRRITVNEMVSQVWIPCSINSISLFVWFQNSVLIKYNHFCWLLSRHFSLNINSNSVYANKGNEQTLVYLCVNVSQICVMNLSISSGDSAVCTMHLAFYFWSQRTFQS